MILTTFVSFFFETNKIFKPLKELKKLKIFTKKQLKNVFEFLLYNYESIFSV